ncbi:hypothetical protein PR202_gb22036 [Eleusine coracana subsp. coracana]|uniref:Acid phosphatase 1 n=1 Tax=Eleusine coracana subsp. coracana TaxID=191504 RepID=A0AAV5FEM9_ELECO|nr:hypothetical protein QOZ80_7BG0613090 [Eleusine coracana subsp. coracana]GJN33437.1 hypothetical protein PR202_gb22036 [Eleusine coracana subsp. coracana]
MATASPSDWTKLVMVLIVVRCLMMSFVLEAAAAAEVTPWSPSRGGGGKESGGYQYCLSWRVMMVEANNANGWRAVPAPCVGYVWAYMSWGQYHLDVATVADQAAAYAAAIAPADDGRDAWVLDVDDTCLSNLLYYQAKQFGAYDPVAFKAWASRGICPGIPPIRQLFQTLKRRGFRIFLVSGRDEETFRASTAANLVAAGFSGYDRLILRGADHQRGESAVSFKSWVRRRLVEEEGYRIRGNVGDQWSDLQGHFAGDRVFKLPNPMYFVP